MSIIQDIMQAVKEVQTTLSSASSAKDKITGAGTAASKDSRFFDDRPISSVAAQARKSVLLFPVVASESLSTDTIGMLTKLVQVRCADYVRIMVTNMDPVQTSTQGKQAVVDALSGASLSDSAFSENTAEATEYFVRNPIAVALDAMAEHYALNAPIETFLEVSNERLEKMRQFSKHLKKGNSDDDQEPKGESPRYQKPSSGQSSGEKDYSMYTGSERMNRYKEANGIPLETKEEAARKAAAVANSPRGREFAKNFGVNLDHEEETLDLETTFRLAEGNLSDRRRATAMIADALQAEDEKALKALRKNPVTAPILAMLEKLPEDAIDEVKNGNRVAVSDRIDYDKLKRISPLMLDLTITYRAGDQVMDTRTHLVLGIKGVAHAVPSLDLVTGFGTSLQRDSLLLQFLRLTSGETSFVKDFVLNMNVAKARASSKTSSGTKVLETLRRQTEWNERRSSWLVSAIAKRGFIPPTATVAITSDEAAKIRSLYGVDFTKPSTVRELLRSHNLMGFMIVDESLGLVRIFEDGDDDFDRLPFSELKARGNTDSIKDLLTIMART